VRHRENIVHHRNKSLVLFRMFHTHSCYHFRSLIS
jgi:hypothetical protein